MDKVLLYFAIKYNGNWEDIYKAISKKEHINYDELQDVEKKIDCNAVTIFSPDYPLIFKDIYKPPFALFYSKKLDIKKLSKIKFSIAEQKLNEENVENLKSMYDILKDRTLFNKESISKIKEAENQIVISNGISKKNELNFEISECLKPSVYLKNEKIIGNFKTIYLNDKEDLTNLGKEFDNYSIIIGTCRDYQKIDAGIYLSVEAFKQYASEELNICTKTKNIKLKI